MSHHSFIVQSKSVNDRKQTRVKPNSLLLFCFSVSFLSLCVVHWPGGYEGGESTSNAPPGKSGKIRRRRQSWLMQCCTPRQYCVVDNACLCICIFVFLSLCICINPGLCSAVHQGNGGLLTHRQYGNKKQRQRGNRGMWQYLQQMPILQCEWEFENNGLVDLKWYNITLD